ncbi:hypothetical protein H4R24_004720 [Coemansia sp. RSA 988]|nr:hypothetical protein H4R24_004720 [Coemansia sp. RSA 988]
MTSRLPPDLLRLFTPRPPLRHVDPLDCPPDKKPAPKLSAIADYIGELENATRSEPTETPKQRKERLKVERARQARDNIVRGLGTWDPTLNLQATEDPYKTVIVARLNYDTSEKDLRNEFERFGDIANIKMANDMEGHFRGYAFVEFVHEADMREAYRSADGMRILGRRIVVDVERGRTVKGWVPRRFGGGLGGTRTGTRAENQRTPGRFNPTTSQPTTSAHQNGVRGRDRGSRTRSYGRSRSRSRPAPRSSGGYHDSRSRGRDHDRDRRQHRYRSRSPSLRPSKRNRSYSRRH